MTFSIQLHAEHLLLRDFSDNGLPNVVSKVGVLRGAVLKKSKKRHAKLKSRPGPGLAQKKLWGGLGELWEDLEELWESSGRLYTVET